MSREQLPPPLPPETRTVGQLVAETLKLYGRHVWLALAIGLAPAVLDLVAGTDTFVDATNRIASLALNEKAVKGSGYAAHTLNANSGAIGVSSDWAAVLAWVADRPPDEVKQAAARARVLRREVQGERRELAAGGIAWERALGWLPTFSTRQPAFPAGSPPMSW